MKLRTLLALLLLGLLSTAPSFAAAQSNSKQARNLFDRAMEALHTGNFAAARDYLNQSIALSPNPAAGFNLGVAYRGSGELLRATEVFEGVLKGEYGKIPSDKRGEVENMLRTTRGELAHLSVVLAGAVGAELRVDGRVVGTTATDPQTFETPVDPGEHVITASAPDHENAETHARLERGGATRVSVTLKPLADAITGTLIVEATDTGDTIIVDGVGQAKGRFERALTPGPYVIHLESKAGKREAKVIVKPRGTVRYHFDAVDDSTIWESPYFWSAVGVGAAAIAVTTIILVGAPQEKPVRDPVYGVTEALR